MSFVDTIRLDMQGKVKRLAEPSPPGESVKSCIRRVSLKTGLSFDETWRLWYAKWKRVPADIYLTIQEKVEAHERRLHASGEIIRQQQATLYGLTHEGCDPEFYQGRASVDWDQSNGS